jgi:DnaD/phage-associated family protein
LNSTLIEDDTVIVVSPKLAQLLGVSESIILSQIHYWLNKSKNIISGKPWVYNTYEEWQQQISFLSKSTIRKCIKKLEDIGIVESNNFNKSKIDKTKWYTINYKKLSGLLNENNNEETKAEVKNRPTNAKNGQSNGLNEAEEMGNSNTAIPDNTTEITHIDDNKCNDDGFEDIINFYSKNIRLPGGYELEKLKYLIEEFKEAELIIFAMQQAISSNARNLRYVEKVLYNWRDNGIENKSAAEAFTESYKKYKCNVNSVIFIMIFK